MDERRTFRTRSMKCSAYSFQGLKVQLLEWCSVTRMPCRWQAVTILARVSVIRSQYRRKVHLKCVQLKVMT